MIISNGAVPRLRGMPRLSVMPRLTVLTGLMLIALPRHALAVDRVVLEVGELSVAGARVRNASLTLDLSPGRPAAHLGAAQLQLLASTTTGSFSSVDLTCSDVVAREPAFACGGLTLSGRGGPTGAFSVNGNAAYDSRSRALSLTASGLAIAGGTARVRLRSTPGSWSVHTDIRALDLAQARVLAQPWISLPEDYTFRGHLDVGADVNGRPGALDIRFDGRTADLNLTNKDGTVVAENLAAAVTGKAAQAVTAAQAAGTVQAVRAAQAVSAAQPVAADVNIQATGGQTLAGPVLFDFGANPLELQAHALYDPAGRLKLGSVSVSQKDLMEAHAEADLEMGRGSSAPPVRITYARIDIDTLTFPAAYRTFLQLELADTEFGALTSSGRASGSIEIVNDSVARFDTRLAGVHLEDPNRRFSMRNLSGNLRWSADPNATLEPSHVTWSSASAYGLSGGAAQLTFSARARSVTLLGDTRLPIFDGALVVHTLAARNFGTPGAELDFDAHIEPISMPMLSKAFGWPELSGRLGGRIPGVRYRDRTLVVDGDLAANVFDGTITGSNFRLVDPLGRWPRLFADVTARKLDLDLVTHTFPIGSITGRMDAEIQGLELFGWSPVAFDARLYSTPGDRSKHLISQKAVTSLSNIGGGAGGVAAALQSGLLKFFDRFHYDRIGLSCRLREEVCLMAGIEPAQSGYYIVKGSGLPRIDVIGNAGRVNWPQLISQIEAGMRSQGIQVR